MSQSPQFAQDYVIDIPQEPGRIPRQRIEEIERRMSPSQARMRAPYTGRISRQRIEELERRMSPQTTRPMIPSSSMTMVKPKRKYTKRKSSKKRSSKKRKISKRKSSKKRSSSCKRGYTSVRTYVRSDTKKRVSRHCSKIGKRRSKK